MSKDRTPQDYAIEHAGYLATAANNYINAVGERDLTEKKHNGEESSATRAALKEADEYEAECLRALQRGIYEFLKRRDLSLSQPAAVPFVPEGLADHIEWRLLIWRRGVMNINGDCLSLSDFMDKDSIDDLVDYVCDVRALAKAAT